MEVITLEYCPIELLIIIFTKLSVKDRRECKLVCKKWLHVLMSYSEFNIDRVINLKTCIYDVNKQPISTFINSKYKYIANNFSVIDTLNKNIPLDFWYENLEITSITITMKVKYFLLVLYDVLSKIQTINTLCFLNVIQLKDYCKFISVDVDHPKFPNIKTIKFDYYKDSNGFFHYNKILKLIFPNLETILYEEFKPVKSYNRYDLNLPYKLIFNRLYECKKDNKSLETYNFSSKPIFNNLISTIDCKTFYNPTCAKLNQKVVLYYNHIDDDNYNWNEYLNVEYLSIMNITKNCFFYHKIVNAKSVTKLNLSSLEENEYCSICLKNLFGSVTNLKKLILKLEFYDKALFSYVNTYCKKIYEVIIRSCNFQQHELSNITNLILITKSDYKNTLSFASLYPNVERIEISLFDFDNLLNVFKSVFIEPNNSLRTLFIKCDFPNNEKIYTVDDDITDEICQLLLKNGNKIQVS